MDAWERGVPAQIAFPQLNASDREFIITGMTDDEWDDTFWNGDEDYNEDEDGEEE
jgi:hypothetical protein